MISLYEELCNRYPIYSIEDGLNEEDWEGWKELTKRLGNKVFNNCKNLKEIELPNGLESIYDNAFEGCISLSTITLFTAPPKAVIIAVEYFSSTSITFPIVL